LFYKFLQVFKTQVAHYLPFLKREPSALPPFEHLHRARLFAIFERMTTTRVGLSLAHPNQKLSGDELFEGAPTAQFYSIR
jgi:hypothetical protein